MHQSCAQCCDLGIRYEVSLGNKNLVCKANLALRFLVFTELLLPMLGIHQRNDRIKHIVICDVVVHKEGLGYWTRISDPGGFDHHPLKLNFLVAALLPKLIQGLHQITPNRATNTAIAHLHNLFLALLDQNIVIDVLFAKLVFDHRNFFSVLCRQDVL